MLDASALENSHVYHASCAPDEFVQKPPCLGVQYFCSMSRCIWQGGFQMGSDANSLAWYLIECQDIFYIVNYSNLVIKTISWDLSTRQTALVFASSVNNNICHNLLFCCHICCHCVHCGFCHIVAWSWCGCCGVVVLLHFEMVVVSCHVVLLWSPLVRWAGTKVVRGTQCCVIKLTMPCQNSCSFIWHEAHNLLQGMYSI